MRARPRTAPPQSSAPESRAARTGSAGVKNPLRSAAAAAEDDGGGGGGRAEQCRPPARTWHFSLC